MSPIKPIATATDAHAVLTDQVPKLETAPYISEDLTQSEPSILYAAECPPDRYKAFSFLFLLGSPDNTPPPCTRRRWLRWKHGLYDDSLKAYQIREGLSDEDLDEVIALDDLDAFRATGWAFDGPQGKAYWFLKEISNKLGGQTAPNRPNHRMTDIVFQELPSSLRGWVAAYALSSMALSNLQSLLDELDVDMQIVVVPLEKPS